MPPPAPLHTAAATAQPPSGHPLPASGLQPPCPRRQAALGGNHRPRQCPALIITNPGPGSQQLPLKPGPAGAQSPPVASGCRAWPCPGSCYGEHGAEGPGRRLWRTRGAAPGTASLARQPPTGMGRRWGEAGWHLQSRPGARLRAGERDSCQGRGSGWPGPPGPARRQCCPVPAGGPRGCALPAHSPGVRDAEGGARLTQGRLLERGGSRQPGKRALTTRATAGGQGAAPALRSTHSSGTGRGHLHHTDRSPPATRWPLSAHSSSRGERPGSFQRSGARSRDSLVRHTRGAVPGAPPAAGGRGARRWGCSCRSWRGAAARCTRRSTRCCDTPAPSA